MIQKHTSHLGASIVRTGRLLINSVNSHFTATGANITFEQLEVLIHISANPEKQIIQTDLAIVMQKNKSGILRTIDVLEKKQFVKRSPVAGDRRKNVIEVTMEGYLVAKEAMDIFYKLEQNFMNKIKEEDALTCIRVLDIIKAESLPSVASLCEAHLSPMLTHSRSVHDANHK